VRSKYALREGEGVVIGKLPSQPIDKCIAGPGLLAQVIIDKYVDHLPLYRQEQRFSRVGITLAPSTLCNWKSSVCSLITPLYDAIVKEVLQTNYLHVDETTIKVLDTDKKRHYPPRIFLGISQQPSKNSHLRLPQRKRPARSFRNVKSI
jgi:transposase